MTTFMSFLVPQSRFWVGIAALLVGSGLISSASAFTSPGRYAHTIDVRAQGFSGVNVRDREWVEHDPDEPGFPGYAPLAAGVIADGVARSRGYIDLSAGVLRGYVSGEFNPNAARGMRHHSSDATIIYEDWLRVGGVIEGVQTGYLTVTFTGSLLSPPTDNFATARAALSIHTTGFLEIPGSGGYSDAVFQTNCFGCPSTTQFSAEVKAPFKVRDDLRDIGFMIQMNLRAVGLSWADLEHTIYLDRIELPEGLTFTTASGLGFTTPVPEPSTIALHVAGIALIALALRRTRARVRSE